jgi:hypothetical protein
VVVVVPRPPSLNGDAFAPVDKELANGEETVAVAPVLRGVAANENPLLPKASNLKLKVLHVKYKQNFM